jgi:hypothetical protein
MVWNVFIMVDWAFWKNFKGAGLGIRILVSKEATSPCTFIHYASLQEHSFVTMCKRIQPPSWWASPGEGRSGSTEKNFERKEA